MSLATIIPTIIGAVVGGIVLIFTNWFTARLSIHSDRKKAAQSLFEQFYITEGLVPLKTYFTSLELHLLNLDISKPFIPLAKIDSVPIEAVTRTQTLWGGGELTSLIKSINLCLSQNLGPDATLLSLISVQETLKILEQLRTDMLMAAEKMVFSKGTIPDAFYARDSIKKINQSLMENMKNKAIQTP